MSWRRLLGASAEPTACSCSASSQSTLSRPEASPACAKGVPSCSPAYTLAASLTDPDTRDEWKRVEKENVFGGSLYGHSDSYRNEARDITITRWWAMYSGSGVYTPFELSKAEQAVVIAALDQRADRERRKREAAALSRLTASAIEAGTDKTQSGLAQRARARSRKGDAQ